MIDIADMGWEGVKKVSMAGKSPLVYFTTTNNFLNWSNYTLLGSSSLDGQSGFCLAIKKNGEEHHFNLVVLTQPEGEWMNFKLIEETVFPFYCPKAKEFLAYVEDREGLSEYAKNWRKGVRDHLTKE